MRDDVSGIGLLDDVRGLLEARVEVAGLLRRSGPRVPAHEDNGRRGRHRLFHVGEMGQRLVAHADQSRGVLRALFRVGRDGGDRLALEHAFGSQILPDEGDLHAGGLLRRGQIDRHDAGVRERRADDLAVDHPGSVDVVCVLGTSRHLLGGVKPLHRRADQRRLVRPLVLVGHARRRGLLTPSLRILCTSHEPPPWLSTPLP
jgi:hypothetical protein